jgi:signal transduction histidine kinase
MTIRSRLTLFWAAVLAVILLFAGVAVLVLFQREQWGELDGALLEEADTAAEAITRAGPGAAADIVRQLSEERDLGPARRVQLIVAGRLLADAGAAHADLPALGPIPAEGKIINGRRRVFRYAVMPLTLAGANAYLADGVDATPVRRSIARLQRNLLLTLPLILGVCIGAGYWLAGRALAPVSALDRALAKLDPRDLRRRLPLSAVDDEIARLTCTINALLERVEAAAEVERRFAADAAHEMRTPLAILRTELEIALAQPRSAAEYGDALAAALRETVALCRIADQLLALARLEHEAALERVRLDLGALVREAIATLEPLVQARHLDFCTTIDGPAPVNGNPDHLRRLVVNLLDNALKFTPDDGKIGVELAPQTVRLTTLRIVNSGPPIPAADLPHLFERFFRGHARNQPGSGLGLSLCQEIARLHGGKITAANLAAGGVEFVLRLPTADLVTPRHSATAHQRLS